MKITYKNKMKLIKREYILHEENIFQDVLNIENKENSAKREEGYRETIEALADSLQVMNDVKEQVERLVDLMERRENEE